MAKRKSGAEREYNRVRRNFLQQIRRAEKRGAGKSYNIPMTPNQALWGTGNKPTAADFRKATKELNEIRTGIPEQPTKIDIPDVSDIIIENFTKGLEQGEGGAIIKDSIERFQNQYGSEAVAQALQNMKDSGTAIGRAQFYNPTYAVQYVAEMGEYLRGIDVISDSEWMDFEEALYQDYGEMVPEELQ